MKTTCFLWASILCTLLDGCKVVSTTEVPVHGPFPDTTGKGPFVVHGMPYFLPIGVITIKGDWKDPTKDSGAASKDPASGAPAASLQSGLTFGLVTAASAPGAKKDPGDDASAGQSVTVTIDGWTIKITAEAEADPEQMFYAVPRRNYIFDDDFQVTVNSKHLLSAGKSTVNDRTADVIGAVIQAASALGNKSFGAPPKLKSFLVSFRTDSWKEYSDARRALDPVGFDLTLFPSPPPVRKEPSPPKEEEQGLVFRLAEPYTVSLTPSPNAPPEVKNLDYSHVFVLPSLQPYVVEYHRVAFVKKLQEVGFTDGMLTDYHENLPSPILGVLAIPKAIVGAIVPLVGGGSLGGSGTAPAASPPAATP